MARFRQSGRGLFCWNSRDVQLAASQRNRASVNRSRHELERRRRKTATVISVTTTPSTDLPLHLLHYIARAAVKQDQFRPSKAVASMIIEAVAGELNFCHLISIAMNLDFFLTCSLFCFTCISKAFTIIIPRYFSFLSTFSLCVFMHLGFTVKNNFGIFSL